MSTLRQYRIADWVPKEIRDWLRALNAGRTRPADHLVVVAKILQAGNRYGLERHGRAFIKEFEHNEIIRFIRAAHVGPGLIPEPRPITGYNCFHRTRPSNEGFPAR